MPVPFSMYFGLSLYICCFKARQQNSDESQNLEALNRGCPSTLLDPGYNMGVSEN